MVIALPEKTTPRETPPAQEPVPVEVVRPLKVSEAMRLGSVSTVQAVGYGDWQNTACAITAAVIGYAGAYDSTVFWEVHQYLGSIKARCPAKVGLGPFKRDCPYNMPVNSTIIHLNDHHKMPRHKIADWLEGMGL